MTRSKMLPPPITAMDGDEGVVLWSRITTRDINSKTSHDHRGRSTEGHESKPLMHLGAYMKANWWTLCEFVGGIHFDVQLTLTKSDSGFENSAEPSRTRICTHFHYEDDVYSAIVVVFTDLTFDIPWESRWYHFYHHACIKHAPPWRTSGVEFSSDYAGDGPGGQNARLQKHAANDSYGELMDLILAMTVSLPSGAVKTLAEETLAKYDNADGVYAKASVLNGEGTFTSAHAVTSSHSNSLTKNAQAMSFYDGKKHAATLFFDDEVEAAEWAETALQGTRPTVCDYYHLGDGDTKIEFEYDQLDWLRVGEVAVMVDAQLEPDGLDEGKVQPPKVKQKERDRGPDADPEAEQWRREAVEDHRERKKREDASSRGQKKKPKCKKSHR